LRFAAKVGLDCRREPNPDASLARTWLTLWLDPVLQAAIHEQAGFLDHDLSAAKLIAQLDRGRVSVKFIERTHSLEQSLVRPVKAAVDAQPRFAAFHPTSVCRVQIVTAGHTLDYKPDKQFHSIIDDPDVGRPITSLERECDTPERALGAVITQLRVKREWSYQHVAHRVGCDESYMNGMEHGKRNPSFRVLQAIAHLHGLELSRLLALGEQKYKRCLKKGKAAGASRRPAKAR